MHNVLRILRRDLKRLIMVPSAWVIVIGLTVLPAFYAWVNILGFWDPYGNTSNVRVSVANDDKGTSSSLMGDMNLGDQIVASLKRNHDIGWTFASTAEAMDDVKSGTSYAAIIIPGDFSDRLDSLITGGTGRPTLKYYVNEKASPIAPKVTDTAAGTVDSQVNSTFVSTVSKVISDAVNKAGDQALQTGDKTRAEADKALSDAQTNIANTRQSISRFVKRDHTAATKDARNAVSNARRLGKDASSGLSGVSGLIDTTRTGLNSLSESSSKALDQSNNLLSQAASAANASLDNATGSLTTANGKVSGALDSLQDINDRNEALLGDLNDLAGKLPGSALDGAIAQLQQTNATLGGTITDLNNLNTSLGNTITDTGKLGDSLNASSQQALDSLASTRNSLTSSALPQLNNGLGTMSATTGTLSGQIAGQGTLLDQVSLIIDQLDQSMKQATKALNETDQSLASVEQRISTMRTDLTALSTSHALDDLLGADGNLDTKRIADFMLSPTVLDTKTVYPVNSYGSGMAPLFTNLAMWAGAFMLVALIRLETDDEGIEDMTTKQGYMGRWLLLAILAAAQGLIVTIGDLIIGVQTVNPQVFVITGLIASLVYISFAYMLATTFLHVGKALIMVMIIIQIPGAGGMYPIEMMPAFFRNLHPYFPFTYTIDAMRETIGGFYDGVWHDSILHLLLFAAISFAVGLFVRPMMANVNRLFAREIAESDILTGEPVKLRAHEFRVAQALRALNNRKEYREAISERAAWFTDMYPKLKRGALIVGLGVPVVLCIVFSLTTNTKLIALGTWSIWVLMVIAFLMTIELMRDSLQRQVALGNLDDATIRAQLALRQLDHQHALRLRRRRRAIKLQRKEARHAAQQADGLTPHELLHDGPNTGDHSNDRKGGERA